MNQKVSLLQRKKFFAGAAIVGFGLSVLLSPLVSFASDSWVVVPGGGATLKCVIGENNDGLDWLSGGTYSSEEECNNKIAAALKREPLAFLSKNLANLKRIKDKMVALGPGLIPSGAAGALGAVTSDHADAGTFKLNDLKYDSPLDGLYLRKIKLWLRAANVIFRNDSIRVLGGDFVDAGASAKGQEKDLLKEENELLAAAAAALQKVANDTKEPLEHRMAAQDFLDLVNKAKQEKDAYEAGTSTDKKVPPPGTPSVPTSPKVPGTSVPVSGGLPATAAQYQAADVRIAADRLRALVTEHAAGAPFQLLLPGSPTVTFAADTAGHVRVTVAGGGTYDVTLRALRSDGGVVEELRGTGITFSISSDAASYALLVTYLATQPQAPISLPAPTGATPLPPAPIPTTVAPKPIVPAPAPGEGNTEPISDVVYPCVGGTGLTAKGTPCSGPVTPPVNGQPESGPQTTEPPAVPPEVAPPTAPTEEAIVNATLEEAPQGGVETGTAAQPGEILPTEQNVPEEKIDFNIDLVPQSTGGGVQPAIEGGSAPNFDFGGLTPTGAAPSAPQEIGNLSVSGFLPSALPTGLTTSGETAPVVGAGATEQVSTVEGNLEFAGDNETPVQVTSPAGSLTVGSSNFYTPQDQTVGQLPVSVDLPDYFQAGQINLLDVTAPVSNDLLVSQANAPVSPATLGSQESEQITDTLQFDDQALQGAVNTGAAPTTRNIAVPLQFIPESAAGPGDQKLNTGITAVLPPPGGSAVVNGVTVTIKDLPLPPHLPSTPGTTQPQQPVRVVQVTLSPVARASTAASAGGGFKLIFYPDGSIGVQQVNADGSVNPPMPKKNSTTGQQPPYYVVGVPDPKTGDRRVTIYGEGNVGAIINVAADGSVTVVGTFSATPVK